MEGISVDFGGPRLVCDIAGTANLVIWERFFSHQTRARKVYAAERERNETFEKLCRQRLWISLRLKVFIESLGYAPSATIVYNQASLWVQNF
jgi:hypothetical protein